MRHGFRLFDAHAHIGAARHSGRVFPAERMLASMDRFGVDRALLIPWPVVEDYRAAHDEIGRAVRAHPDRFAGAACIDPFLPEAEFRGELRRCAEELGFRALKLQPQYHGLNPVSPRSDFFFAAALGHRMAVVAHTGAGVPFALPSLFIPPARKFPDLPIVLSHCGSALYAAEGMVAAMVCSNIYLELSSILPHQVQELLTNVPSSRLMIGSDLPENLELEMGKILGLETDEETRRDILWETAARLFGG